jgi:threonine/homoserine/homoserine lactone efflux protein
MNLILWVGGGALVWLGYQRARGPWARYQDLKAQDANVARYEAWRGGARDDAGTTGASVAMAILRRQAQVWVALAIVGLGAIVLGFVIH